MHTPFISLNFLLLTSLLSACTETLPVKESTPEPAKVAEAKSIQDIAKEAMTSKGKLSQEQVSALIRANAACRPNDKY
ncbi:MAG: hypothetical protein QJT81_03060 [Candidatus Thiothrix putei]|uniref:Lipoprotein n=1 Tax=Candidatus Thiothrix putei TaxID=3080811 RepID=A0AA95KJ41_9GAMM|nr:MAG: hypothetical protein QJT81_03060 [Candidatus Thiothrix putei]